MEQFIVWFEKQLCKTHNDKPPVVLPMNSFRSKITEQLVSESEEETNILHTQYLKYPENQNFGCVHSDITKQRNFGQFEDITICSANLLLIFSFVYNFSALINVYCQ